MTIVGLHAEALSNPYCQSTCLSFCLSVCPQLWHCIA